MKNLFFITIILISFNGTAQFSGYYGKKNYVDVDYKFYVPMFGNLRGQNEGYDENLKRKVDWFNYGFRVNLGRLISNHVSIGFEFDQDYAQVPAPYSIYGNSSYGYYYIGSLGPHEMIDINTITIMPKIGVSRKSIQPLGITHEFGIGYTITSVQDKDYAYKFTFTQYDENLGVDTQYNLTNQNNGPLIDKDTKFKGVTLLYGLNVKKNLTKSLFLNYGIRYTFNWLLGHSKISYDDATSNNIAAFSTEDLFIHIRRQRAYNFVTANIGLTFAF